MMQGAYTAATGIDSQQKRIDTIANNLANSNTTAFKSSKTSFKDALYQNIQRIEQPQNTINMRKGHGALVSGTQRIFTAGQYMETGRSLDCYIDGDGFFMVQSPAGENYFTRDGSFMKSTQADGEYLVTSDGYYVLDQNRQRIRLQGTRLDISTEGGLSQGGGAAEYARLGRFTFPNQNGLIAASNNLYAASAASGQPMASDTEVIQKALEGSNVNLASEFSSLIRASRAMQLASRALTTADEMDGTAISTRR